MSHEIKVENRIEGTEANILILVIIIIVILILLMRRKAQTNVTETAIQFSGESYVFPEGTISGTTNMDMIGGVIASWE